MTSPLYGAQLTLTDPLFGDAIKLALVLALSFLVGFDREERKQAKTVWTFGGVRAYPLIGLSSYALALIGGGNLLPWSLGFAVVGGLMLLSYQHKLTASEQVSATAELSALLTYLTAGLVVQGAYWIAATLAVASVLLLQLKKELEGLTRHVAPEEVTTVAQFLLLSVVILPLVPDRDFTRFAVNPFRTWLIVLAVSGISFGSYGLQRVLKGRGGIMLSALLGGAYSSTVTTVVLAREGRAEPRPNLIAGSILAASGTMYVRLLALIAFFNAELATILAPGFALAAVGGIAGGWFWSRRAEQTSAATSAPTAANLPAATVTPPARRNPLELRTAFVLAVAFPCIIVIATLAREYLGQMGLYALATLMGVTDVDPFILGLTQTHATTISLHAAAVAIIIASSSNNLAKAAYARSFGDAATGRMSVGLLGGLAVLGALGLIWV